MGHRYPGRRYPRDRYTCPHPPKSTDTYPHWYRHIVAATKTGMGTNRAVRILECFFLYAFVKVTEVQHSFPTAFP